MSSSLSVFGAPRCLHRVEEPPADLLRSISRQAIKKYIQANNNLGATTDAQFSSHISKALQTGEDANVFSRPKGM